MSQSGEWTLSWVGMRCGIDLGMRTMPYAAHSMPPAASQCMTASASTVMQHAVRCAAPVFRHLVVSALAGVSLLCSAKLDCSWRGPGTTTNVANTATGCRTVVERPKPICPSGCVVLEQWRWNTTVNRTQLFTKCSCKAGNQPCPSLWTACTCYEGLNSQNLTRGFVVCSETQGECDRKCNLAVSGNPRLAPLCPVAMDPFLSIKPTDPPIYPSFGWNIASQAANQAATLGTAGRSLKQWVSSLGRRLTMAAESQLRDVSSAVLAADGARGSHAGAPDTASVKRSQQQQRQQQQSQQQQSQWLQHACCGVKQVAQWLADWF